MIQQEVGGRLLFVVRFSALAHRFWRVAEVPIKEVYWRYCLSCDDQVREIIAWGDGLAYYIELHENATDGLENPDATCFVFNENPDVELAARTAFLQYHQHKFMAQLFGRRETDARIPHRLFG